jgi:uracil-DNA glycosylase family 4
MGQYAEQLKADCVAKGLKYVGFRGDVRSPVCVLGEAPGEEEDRQGYPFCGPSGQELDREIRDAGISAGDVWFTNCYRVRPPDNKLPRLPETGTDPTLHEKVLLEELFETKPTFLVTCGQTATNYLIPDTVVKRGKKDEEGISFSHWRGSLLQSPYLPWDHYVVPLYHPSFILREYSERDINVFILKRVCEELHYWRANGKIQPLPERELLTQPNIGQAIEFLRERLYARSICGVDIEMLRRKIPYTIAISDTPNRAMSICFWDYGPSDTARLLRYLSAFLRKSPVVGQNFTTFDANWLRVIGLGCNIDLVDDTLIRHHVLWPELSHKLEFQVMQYTREPFFKEEGRGWAPRDGKTKLMKYNCKDACTTLEIYNEQEKEFDEEPAKRNFYRDYEMPLARRYYNIDQRGICIDTVERDKLRTYISNETDIARDHLQTIVGGRVFTSTKKIPEDAPRQATDYLLSFPGDVIRLLKDRGLKPKKTFKGGETSNEEALNELLAESGDQAIKDILRIRELEKFKGTYVDQKLFHDTSYTNYNVAGTLGGRRSARKNFLKFGSNHQNQPKHSDLAHEYRKMLVARPGKILVFCDQVQAEDWIVNGIIADVAGIRTGLDELLAGVDRHKKLAAYLFSLPESECGKGTPQRFLGKKVRHAGNYDMRENRMAAALAKEGYSMSPAICAKLLGRFHENNPEIRGVFHEWVKINLAKRRSLESPLGRSRSFFGLRPYSNNDKLFKEAYSYVPQTTVGDNTGMAVLYCESHDPGLLIHECHDSIGLEVDFDFDRVLGAMKLLDGAFDRIIKFANGLEIKIPIEFELGFNFGELTTCANSSRDGLQAIWDTLAQQQKLRTISNTGVLLPQ